ncbi:MAG: DegT/DnrJ/EryC1/StrS family aminotransferase [Flavobacteriales bacterium]
MKPIQLVDLHSQYLRIKEEIDKSVLDVIESCQFIGGEHVKEFSRELEEYTGIKHVIPCANGTDALQIALMAIDAQPGDEILTPSFTYIATCEVIALLGLKPVFVEVDTDTFTMDVDDARSKITSKTKAVVPVHLYGQCANMDAVMDMAGEHGIKVIEDTAQALGSKYFSRDGEKPAGGIGDIGTTSFFPSKNLGCFGDGGAILTNDDGLAAKIRMIANHGQSKRYYHDSIGVNSRLDNMQAAILRIKLRHLNEYIEQRNQAAEFYNKAFEGMSEITTPLTAPWSNHGYHQYTMKLHGVDREGLQKHLDSKGIPTNIYYPIPAHLQKGYAQYGMKEGSMPRTEQLTTEVLSLPIHTELDNEQLNYIANSIKEYIKG